MNKNYTIFFFCQKPNLHLSHSLYNEHRCQCVCVCTDRDGEGRAGKQRGEQREKTERGRMKILH